MNRFFLFFKFPLIVFLTALITAGGFQEAQACIDPDSAITTNINYDSTYNKVEVRFSNLRLMTEAPNKFCSCGLASYFSFFSGIQYAAFVDSGTNNVYQNFTQWANTQAADNSWDADQTGFGSWKGFLAGVTGMGLAPTHAVELVVRIDLPAGYSFSLLDSSVTTTTLGTDEWDNVNSRLANSHQRARRLGTTTIVYERKPDAYFYQLDDDITGFYTSCSCGPEADYVTVFPNPASDYIQLDMISETNQAVSARLLDTNGRLVAFLGEGKGVDGHFRADFDIAKLKLQPGLYLVEVTADGNKLHKKVVIQ